MKVIIYASQHADCMHMELHLTSCPVKLFLGLPEVISLCNNENIEKMRQKIFEVSRDTGTCHRKGYIQPS